MRTTPLPWCVWGVVSHLQVVPVLPLLSHSLASYLTTLVVTDVTTAISGLPLYLSVGLPLAPTYPHRTYYLMVLGSLTGPTFPSVDPCPIVELQHPQ